MRGDQLDLFIAPDVPAKIDRCEVLIFPPARMVGAMRYAAVEMLAMSPKDQWKKLEIEAIKLRYHLSGLGMPLSEISTHVEAFKAGITAEARRIIVLDILSAEHGGIA